MSPQIGMYYFVPFKNKKKIKDANGKETTTEVNEATFQLSYRGMLQLAMRSGQYKSMNVTDIREGELVSYNPIEDVYEFKAETDITKREKLPIIGYYAFFEMVNGFKKGVYWTREQVDTHAKRYSASYRNGWSSSLWKTDFDAMAKKTLLRQLISKWGIMSVDMETAYASDQAVIRDGVPDYVDNIPDDPVPDHDHHGIVILDQFGGLVMNEVDNGKCGVGDTPDGTDRQRSGDGGYALLNGNPRRHHSGNDAGSQSR